MVSLQEIREELSVGDWTITNGGSWTLYVKKINLNQFKRFEIIHADFMDDSQLIPQKEDFGYEFYMSVYPIHPTNMRFAEAFTNGGPSAADDNVLFKQAAYNIEITPTNPLFSPYVAQRQEQFPNQFLAQMPTFNFYSPHIYMNLLIHTNVLDEGPGEVLHDMRMSMYLALNEYEVNDITWQIGRIREVMNAQFKLLITAGVVQNISSDTLNPAGRWISWPAWTWGGIIPERMVDVEGAAIGSSSLATGFVNLGPNQAELMMSTDNQRIFFNASRTMVTAGTAFGADDAVKGPIPDWLNFSAMTEVYGPQRPDYPSRIFPTMVQAAAGFDQATAIMV